MEHVLMYTNMQQYNERINEYTKRMAGLPEIIEAYNALNIGGIITSEFKQLIHDPERMVFDKMTGGKHVEVGGFKINPEKAFGLLHMPNGFDKLKSAVDKFKANVHWQSALHFVDVSENKVVMSQRVRDSELENAKVYAKTDSAKKAFEFITKTMQLAEEMFGKNTVLYRTAMSKVGEMVFISPGINRDVHINHSVIAGFGGSF